MFSNIFHAYNVYAEAADTNTWGVKHAERVEMATFQISNGTCHRSLFLVENPKKKKSVTLALYIADILPDSLKNYFYPLSKNNIPLFL